MFPRPKHRTNTGLSWNDRYPHSYIYKPSERMKKFWAEHEKSIDSDTKRTPP